MPRNSPGSRPQTRWKSGLLGAALRYTKRAPSLRDDICAQCHLTGAVRVVRAGRGDTAFIPGQPLAVESCKQPPAARRASSDKCAACHMPKQPAADAEHVVYTDHSIPRKPVPQREPSPGPLKPFQPGMSAADRELGLAYAIAAQRAENQNYAATALKKPVCAMVYSYGGSVVNSGHLRTVARGAPRVRPVRYHEH